MKNHASAVADQITEAFGPQWELAMSGNGNGSLETKESLFYFGAPRQLEDFVGEELAKKQITTKETPDGEILVAHVTVDGETMTVEADKIADALEDLTGKANPGLSLQPTICYSLMSKADFVALPEYQ